MAKKILIVKSDEQMNMVSIWRDEVYLTCLSNGKFSLHLRKNLYSDGTFWFPAKTNISRPSELIDAFSSFDGIDPMYPNFEDDILPNLIRLHPKLGTICELEYLTRYEEEGADDLISLVHDFIFFCKFSEDLTTSLSKENLRCIREFVVSFINKNNDFPKGEKKIGAVNVIFPKRLKLFKSELMNMYDTNMVLQHAQSATWNRSSGYLNAGFANLGRRKKVIKFAMDYYNEHGKLPFGYFHFEDVKVTF